MNYNLKNTFHVAVPTAFNEDESLNVEQTLKHMLYLKGQGVQSLLVCGSTGEQHGLTLEEKLYLLSAIEKEPSFDNDFEILFGVASIRQKEALLLAEEIAKATSISGILLGFPPYILPTQKEAVSYFNKIVDVVDKPVIVYNNPRRTGFDVSMESLIQLFENEKVIGIKEAGESSRIPSLIETINRKIYVYAGGEADLKNKIELGFDRLSSMFGNLYPIETSKWFNSLLEGENAPFVYQEKLEDFSSSSTLAYLKNKITEKENIDLGKPRSPLGN